MARMERILSPTRLMDQVHYRYLSTQASRRCEDRWWWSIAEEAKRATRGKQKPDMRSHLNLAHVTIQVVSQVIRCL